MKITWDQHSNKTDPTSSNLFFIVLHKSGGVDSPDVAKMWLEVPSKAELYAEGNCEEELLEAFSKLLKEHAYDSEVELYAERAY